MWSRASRIAPVGVASLVLTRTRDRSSGGEATHCLEHFSEHKGERRSLRTVISSEPADSTKKGLLAQKYWIYRLVCKEDILKVYDIERELGQGGFGVVYLGQHKELGYHRAVKKITKNDAFQDPDELMNEIYTLMSLDHPNIIQLSRMYDDGHQLYIVSELCNGPALYDRIVESPMSEQEASAALRHMLRAVQCCHSHYMGHYDIKPENFMYKDPDCKKLMMIDLGLSSGFKRDARLFKGTAWYAAPEVFDGMYGPEADVWSCGAVFFCMVTGQPLCPMDIADDKVAILLQDRRWVKQRLQHASASGKASESCMELLTRMLCYDRHMRITASDALKHPFIQDAYRQRQPKWRRESRRDQDAALTVIKSMVDRFTDFGAEPVLVQAVLLVMVHIDGYHSKDTHSHRAAYSMLDQVGSGELSIDAIEQNMPKYGFRVPDNLDDACRCVDLNRNGYITYGNFLAATLPDSLRRRESLCRRVFQLLDQNHDGFIDVDDLATTFLPKEQRNFEAFRQLCRQAIAEVSGSSGKHRLDVDDFISVVMGRELSHAAS